ncbi:unnamed protein product [Chondrus crispus]|uniref:TLDc domain-containing protein n=1 Tax=Chondrus crispus TaxID=2769 RepID=R7QU23_CHOCR|nr:unnamed protein product [Chondrus crispus]CDF40865.1 unnamed protein product [Chondrus crispus]|eukprot:XP_005711159.1 unnamed protein product [Chondrus crispus]
MMTTFLLAQPILLRCRGGRHNRQVISCPPPYTCNIHFRQVPMASTPSPADKVSPRTLKDSPLVPETKLPEILAGTMLAGEPLAMAFNSSDDGFDHELFFERMIPLGGVPSLVLGKTLAGVCFGGYAANGFLARDDYREATTERSMFVFRIDACGDVLLAENTDPIQYDFYDYAIRFGAALLGIPMNPTKHILKSNVGTSSCKLPNGETSVLGDATMGKIDQLQVWVAKRYIDEVNAQNSKSGKGFFRSLFG